MFLTVLYYMGMNFTRHLVGAVIVLLCAILIAGFFTKITTTTPQSATVLQSAQFSAPQESYSVTDESESYTKKERDAFISEIRAALKNVPERVVVKEDPAPTHVQEVPQILPASDTPEITPTLEIPQVATPASQTEGGSIGQTL
jgi:hypothetical protein